MSAKRPTGAQHCHAVVILRAAAMPPYLPVVPLRKRQKILGSFDGTSRAGKTLNILVTGGAGFIGSHVCKVMARRKLVPVVYDNHCRAATVRQ
jgi:hypothetical protein